MRRCAVAVATANMSPANADDHHSDSSTAAMTRAAAASCTTARQAAVTWSRPTPKPANRDVEAATTTRTTTTTASFQSVSGALAIGCKPTSLPEVAT